MAFEGFQNGHWIGSDGSYTREEYERHILAEAKSHAMGRNYLWPAPENSLSWQRTKALQESALPGRMTKHYDLIGALILGVLAVVLVVIRLAI